MLGARVKTPCAIIVKSNAIVRTTQGVSNMATKSEVLVLARKRYGPQAQVSENTRAMKPAERAKAEQRLTEIRARLAEIKDDVGRSVNIKGLMAAARFVVDVDGDDPSLPQLRTLLEEAERIVAAQAEHKALRDEWNGLGLHRQRWEVWHPYTLPGLGRGRGIDTQANTLDELAEKLAK